MSDHDHDDQEPLLAAREMPVSPLLDGVAREMGWPGGYREMAAEYDAWREELHPAVRELVDEIEARQQDLALYGTCFVLDGKRVPPDTVRILRGGGIGGGDAVLIDGRRYPPSRVQIFPASERRGGPPTPNA